MRHHSHSANDNPSQLAGIAILSAIIGAVTALVLAPKTGRQTRQEVRKRLATTKEDMKNRLSTAKDVVADEAKSASDTLSDAAMIGKEHVEQVVNDAKRTARSAKEDVDDTTDEIRKNGER